MYTKIRSDFKREGGRGGLKVEREAYVEAKFLVHKMYDYQDILKRLLRNGQVLRKSPCSINLL